MSIIRGYITSVRGQEFLTTEKSYAASMTMVLAWWAKKKYRKLNSMRTGGSSIHKERGDIHIRPLASIRRQDGAIRVA